MRTASRNQLHRTWPRVARAFSSASVQGPPMHRAPPSASSQTRGGEAPPNHPMMSGEIPKHSASEWLDMNKAGGSASKKKNNGSDEKPLDPNDPAAHWEKVKEAARESAEQKKQKAKEDEAAPPIINVPSLCSRCVGRGNDIFTLWQRMHGGRRVLVLRGVDGIGKSSLAAEFGEHARRSTRFTCVQWINGRQAIAPQLQALLKEVRGRKEVKAMLIFDDVEQPEAVLSLLPPNDAFVAVITTNNLTAFATHPGIAGDAPAADGAAPSFLAKSVYVHDVGPPNPSDASELMVDAMVGGTSASAIGLGARVDDEPELPPDQPMAAALRQAAEADTPQLRVTDADREQAGLPPSAGPEEVLTALAGQLVGRLSCVPLLCHLAGCYMHQSGKGPSDVAALLDEKAPLAADGGMSVSSTLAALVDLALSHLTETFGDATAVQRAIDVATVVNGEDLNPGLLMALAGDDGVRVLSMAVAYGLASSHWGNDAFALQPLVAKDLRRRLYARGPTALADIVATTSPKLLGMWPRRWRGMGADRALSLAKHTAALHDVVVHRPSEFGELRMPMELVAAVDRAATFLGHISGRDLERAGALWRTLLRQYEADGVCNAEAARVAVDAAKVAYQLNDFNAKETTASAHALAVKAHGARSAEAALALTYRVRFLPFTEATIEEMATAADVLDAVVASSRKGSDELTEEEAHMFLEALFVLRLGACRATEAVKGEVPQAQWDALQRLHAQLKDSQTAKRVREDRERAKLKSGGSNAFDLDRE